MDYAICLLFDSDTESAFTNIINEIADSGAGRYMIDTKIPPHITIALFQTEQIEPIIEAVSKNIAGFSPEKIAWASLGVFVPQCIFAAPVMDEYLRNACIVANRLAAPFSRPGDDGHYLPNHWVPHTALAVKLTSEGLRKAFDIALQQFTFIQGRSTRLMLAECNPFREVQIWNLG